MFSETEKSRGDSSTGLHEGGETSEPEVEKKSAAKNFGANKPLNAVQTCL